MIVRLPFNSKLNADDEAGGDGRSMAVEHRSEPADCGRADDGQTNSVCFDTII